MEPSNPSGSAIRGPWNSPKWPQIAINEAYGAISCPGGPKLVVLPGSRLDLGGIHPDWCNGTFKPIWKCHRRALEQPKMTPNCHKWGLWSHKLPWWPQIGGTAWILVGYMYMVLFLAFLRTSLALHSCFHWIIFILALKSILTFFCRHKHKHYKMQTQTQTL